MIMTVIYFNVISIAVKEENVTNNNLPVGWDLKKAGEESYSSSLGPSRCQRKEETGDLRPPPPTLVSSVRIDYGTNKSG